MVAAVASNTHNDALFDEATEKLSSSESPKVAKLLIEVALIHLRLLLPALASPDRHMALNVRIRLVNGGIPGAFTPPPKTPNTRPTRISTRSWRQWQTK